MLKKCILLGTLIFSSSILAMNVDVYYKDPDLDPNGVKKILVPIEKKEIISTLKTKIHNLLKFEAPKQYTKLQIFCGKNEEPMADTQLISECASTLKLFSEKQIATVFYTDPTNPNHSKVISINIDNKQNILALKAKIYKLIQNLYSPFETKNQEIFCDENAKLMNDKQLINECSSALKLVAKSPNTIIYYKDPSIDSNNVKKISISISEKKQKISDLKVELQKLIKNLHFLFEPKDQKIFCDENKTLMDNNNKVSDCNSTLTLLSKHPNPILNTK